MDGSLWSYGGHHARRKPDGNPVTGEGYGSPEPRRRVPPRTDILLPASTDPDGGPHHHASRTAPHVQLHATPGRSTGTPAPVDAAPHVLQLHSRAGHIHGAGAELAAGGQNSDLHNPGGLLGGSGAASVAHAPVQRRVGLGVGDFAVRPDHPNGSNPDVSPRQMTRAEGAAGAGESFPEDLVLVKPEDRPPAGVTSADSNANQLNQTWLTPRRAGRVPPGGHSSGLW